MITERVYRVAYIDTDRDQEDIRLTFSQCGKIRGIYPYRLGDRYKSVHFFIEFDQQSSVKRARALQIRDARVQVLAYSPVLIDQFMALAPPAGPSVDPTEDAGTSPTRPWTSGKYTPRSWVGRKQNRKAPYKDAQVLAHRAMTATSAGSSGSHDKENHHHHHFQKNVSPSYFAMPALLADGGFASGSCDPIPFTLPSLLPAAVKAEPDNVTRLPPTFIHVDSSSQFAPQLDVGPSITLVHDGNHFDCSLESLTQDVKNAVSVLTQTSAQSTERDKWMIVAGYYRRKGNIQAALTIVTTMVDVLTSPAVGLPEASMKPAYLMMSSCHSDLSKSATADAAKEHVSKAQDYLRKVYGANIPVGPPTVYTRGPSGHRGSLADATNTHGESSSREDDPKQISSRRKIIDDGYLRILEREVQSLRDKQKNNIANLAEAREDKRRLEDELSTERDARRRVERELEDATHELSGARRSEKYALEQCKREVEIRRRIEERAGDDLAMLRREMGDKAVEWADRQKRLREAFGQLGASFETASKGDMDLSSALGRFLPPLPSSMPAPHVTSRRERTTTAGSASRSDDRSGLAV